MRISEKASFIFSLKFYKNTVLGQMENEWENHQVNKASVRQQVSWYEITCTVSMEIRRT